MKSLSALRFNPALERPPSFEDDLDLSSGRRELVTSRRNSDEGSSPVMRRLKHETDSPSSSYSSPSSSSSSSSSPNSPQHSPPSPHHRPLPPPLLPLSSLTDPPPLIPLLSPLIHGRFVNPLGTSSFMPFPQPSNGSSLMAFHHPASVFLRQHQAALAYSYAILQQQRQHQQQQQQQQQRQQQQQQQFIRQQKHLTKDRCSSIFRPHELPGNSPVDRHFYPSKVLPFDCDDSRLSHRKSFQENFDLRPVDLRKITTNHPEESARYNNHQALALSPSKKNQTSGKKLIGIRFLFPPFADHVTLFERAKIWVSRHEYKYFVDWSADDLLKVDPALRPIQPITRQQYKIHMNRSEFCRNVKLKFCLQTDSSWARDFCEKLQKSPAEGGFTGLCQAKIAAADLWRTYSENYRSHQARQPNASSLKGSTSTKTTSTKKRVLATDECPSRKCAKLEPQSSGRLNVNGSDSLLEFSKLRSNIYHCYYRQYNDELKHQLGRTKEGSATYSERVEGSMGARCPVQQEQAGRSKMSDLECEASDNDDDDGDGVIKKTFVKTYGTEVTKSSGIWTPFLKTSTNRRASESRDVKNKNEDEKNIRTSGRLDVEVPSDEISSMSEAPSRQTHVTSGTCQVPDRGRIQKLIFDLKSEDVDFKQSKHLNPPDINNNCKFVFDDEIKHVNKNISNKYTHHSNNSNNINNNSNNINGGPKFVSFCDSELPRNNFIRPEDAVRGARVFPHFPSNRNEERSLKAGQSFDYNLLLKNKNRSGIVSKDQMKISGDTSGSRREDIFAVESLMSRQMFQDVRTEDQRSCHNGSPEVVTSSETAVESVADGDSDNEVDVVHVDESKVEFRSSKVE